MQTRVDQFSFEEWESKLDAQRLLKGTRPSNMPGMHCSKACAARLGHAAGEALEHVMVRVDHSRNDHLH